MAITQRGQILVVDDEPDLCTLYELALVREGYSVQTAGSLLQARQYLASKAFDVVISDMRLPDGLGMELLHELARAKRSERCVMITAYGSAENAVEALKSGAFDYLTKPVDLKQFRLVVQSALAGAPTLLANAALPVRARVPDAAAPTAHSAAMPNASLARIVGDSQVIQQVRDRISKVSRSMAPVLVLGESGTGKELVARAVHACSHRSEGPFVAVNCGAIPEMLLEAEFFGAKKGAYTGATQDREGYFQAAQGGTLFLDEIGDLPLAMQAKLLRAIQERSVRPIGSTQELQVDARIVSATHRDLASCVAAGQFRRDLYYRLNVIEIMVPALRERREDLPMLCAALLARIAQDTGVGVKNLSAQAMAALQQQALQGNVRELENMLHRALALADEHAPLLELDGMTGVDQSEPSAASPAPLQGGLPQDLQGYLDKQERDILVAALQESNYNRTVAANRLGISLRQIRYRIERLQVPMPLTDGPE